MATKGAKITTLGKVAVVGGCGFLGVNIVRLIVERYPETSVTAMDVRTTVNRVDSPRVKYENCDITKAEDVVMLFEKSKFDVVIHTATLIHGITDTRITKDMAYNVNVNGTKNLLAASQKTGVKAFVFTSSASVVVGDVWEVVNADESWPVLTGKDQPEYYSLTKALSEIDVLEANRSSPSFLSCAIRPAAIFGEYDNTILKKTLNIKGASTKFQIGSNDNLFDYTHVKNVAHAHLLAAEALLQTLQLGIEPLDHEKVDGEAFFITNDSPVYFWDMIRRVWQERGLPDDKAYDMKKVFVMGTGLAMVISTLLELIMGLFGKTPNFTRLAVRNSSMTRYYNIDKAKMRLKYQPIVGLEDGVVTGVKSLVNPASTVATKTD